MKEKALQVDRLAPRIVSITLSILSLELFLFSLFVLIETLDLSKFSSEWAYTNSLRSAFPLLALQTAFLVVIAIAVTRASSGWTWTLRSAVAWATLGAGIVMGTLFTAFPARNGPIQATLATLLILLAACSLISSLFSGTSKRKGAPVQS